MERCGELRAYLAGRTRGNLADTEQVEILLARAWPSFARRSDSGLVPQYAPSGLEHVEWDPPYLTFRSEESSLRVWVANVEKGTVTCFPVGAAEQPASMPIERLADAIARIIVRRVEDPRVVWEADGRARVRISLAVPFDGPRRLVEERRKRFAEALREALAARGWRNVPRRTDQRSSFSSPGSVSSQ